MLSGRFSTKAAEDDKAGPDISSIENQMKKKKKFTEKP